VSFYVRGARPHFRNRLTYVVASPASTSIPLPVYSTPDCTVGYGTAPHVEVHDPLVVVLGD